MAKSSKNKTRKSQHDQPEVVEDAVTLEGAAIEDIVVDDALDADTQADIIDTLEGDRSEVETADTVEEPEINEPSEISEPEAPPAPVQDAESKSIFLPLVVGGIVAAAIGYGFATFTAQDTNYSEQIAAQAAQIEALEARIAQVPGAPDLSGIEGQISEVENCHIITI